MSELVENLRMRKLLEADIASYEAAMDLADYELPMAAAPTEEGK